MRHVDPSFHLVADRVLTDGDERAIDLATGRDVTLRVSEAAPAADQRAWAEQCARRFVRRHPHEPVLWDYGTMGTRLRFEAIDAAARRAPLVRSRCTLQPRAAVQRAAAWLDEPPAERVRELWITGPPGSGLDTTADLIAREARLRGFVPVDAWWLASSDYHAIVSTIASRHVLVLRRYPTIGDRAALAHLARRTERPLAIISFGGTAPARVPLISLEPLSEAALQNSIGAQELSSAERKRFHACVLHSAGWPGVFLDHWNARRKPSKRQVPLASRPEPRTPSPDMYALRPEARRPKPDVHALKPEPRIPSPDVHASRPEARRPKPGMHAVKPEPRTPSPDVDALRPEARRPKPGMHALKPEPRAPSPDVHASRPEARRPKPGMHALRPEAPGPKPGMHALRPEAPGPKPGMHALKPEPRTPKPGMHALKPEPRSPKPDVRYPLDPPPPLIAAERAPAYGAASADSPIDAAGEEVDAAIERGERLARSGRHAMAMRLLRMCAGRVERRGAGVALARVRIALGHLLHARARVGDAIAMFDGAREALGNDAPEDVWCELTVALCAAFVDHGELKRSESVARVALSSTPDEAKRSRIGAALAASLFWQARYDEADEVWHHHGAESDAACLAVQARVALARGDLGVAGSCAQRALDLTNDAADAMRVSALWSATVVSGAIADRQRARDYAGEAALIARRAHRPLWKIEARLGEVEALARARDRTAARAALLPLARIARDRAPLLLRSRIATLLAAIAPELGHHPIDPSRVRIDALADLYATAGGGGDAPRRRVRDDLRDLLEVAQNACDDATALNGMVTAIAAAVRHPLVAFIGLEGSSPRVLATTAARASGPMPEVASRAIDVGVLVGPTRGPDGVEVAAPVRSAGAIVGALFCRWIVEGPLDWTRIEVLLTAAAAAAGPSVRGLAERATHHARQIPAIDLLGTSDVIAQVRERVAKAAVSPFTVVIEGESGSGKELVARAIHRASPRRDRKWCAVNCAALPDDLLEAELFGHARGAFTGALNDRPGLFEEADGGTLFLDEVGELSPRAQAKLLRTLQEGEVRRLGEHVTRRVDVRIVAATNRRLADEVSAGRFRQDLWYRLAVVRIVVPALRDRADDVPELAREFWRRAAERIGSRAVLAPATVAALARYDWPGNVRELQNVMAAVSVSAPRRGVVPPACLPEALVRAAAPAAASLDEARRTFERRFVRAALARAGGRVAVAARDLGVTRQGLTKLMARLDVNAGE